MSDQNRAVPIEVNGVPREVAAETGLADLLALLGLAERRVAVAINSAVVPRSAYAAQRLGAGDRVEILEAVGGG